MRLPCVPFPLCYRAPCLWKGAGKVLIVGPGHLKALTLTQVRQGEWKTLLSFNLSLSLSLSLSPELRTRLQRISREVTERKTGYGKRKPPPVCQLIKVLGRSFKSDSFSPQPYECVGNSIGYQLLLQNHPGVTSSIIDSLYPALKASTHNRLINDRTTHTYMSYF